MALIVQKYGGTSLSDAQHIQQVAQRIGATKDAGNDVVAVVSAMGKTTDELVNLARQVAEIPDSRELDLLLSTGEIVSCTLMAMALRHLGYQAISLSGAQAGIRTDSAYSQARIVDLDPQRLWAELKTGNVVIVAGFQGSTPEMDITTLGRGGSDITAVALAAALKAQRCEIYTDVEGIYTADPRVVPQARKLEEIGYQEMLELANYGAKMHPRAIELGAVYNVSILVASSTGDAPGTLIHGEADMEVRNKVRGVAYDLDVAKITLRGVPDQPGVAVTLFQPLADAGISVDTIVQNASIERLTDLTFTISRNDVQQALEVARPAALSLSATECLSDDTLSKVSIVGTGMQNAPGYAARMFQALYQAGINIEIITTSEIRITCIVAQDRVHDAVRALHQAFELDQPDQPL